MLKNIPAILSPELVKTLCEMGHGDRICIGDGNFPGASMAKPNSCVFLRADGHGVNELLDAILQVMPLDPYVEKPVALMEVVPGDTVETPIWDTYKEIIAKYDERGGDAVENIERCSFYDRTRENSYVVIMSSETALYAKKKKKKGVI